MNYLQWSVLAVLTVNKLQSAHCIDLVVRMPVLHQHLSFVSPQFESRKNAMANYMTRLGKMGRNGSEN